MITKLKDKIKEKIQVKKQLKLQGKSNFNDSLGHAIDGINYTIDHERNFRIEISFAILVTILSFLLKVSTIEWCILVLTIGIVLSLELLNTAIERSVDLVTKEYKELAKIAKDTSAGAVLIMSLFSVVIGITIFLPKLLELINL